MVDKSDEGVKETSQEISFQRSLNCHSHASGNLKDEFDGLEFLKHSVSGRITKKKEF